MPALNNMPGRGIGTASAWRHKWERLNAQTRTALNECLNDTRR